MTQVTQLNDKNFSSTLIDVTNINGVNYINANVLAEALGLNVSQVSSILSAATKTVSSDAAILTINTLTQSRALCNARGFVAVLGDLIRAGASMQMAQDVLEALLIGSQLPSHYEESLISSVEVLELKLVLVNTFLADAEMKNNQLQALVDQYLAKGAA